MNKKKNKSFKIANEELGKAFIELRRSNAAQPHVPKKHKGTRSFKARKAIRDSSD